MGFQLLQLVPAFLRVEPGRIDFLDPVVDHLGSRHRIAYVHKMLEQGTGADRPLALRFWLETLRHHPSNWMQVRIAIEDGLITQAEYNELRRKILAEL